MRMNGKMAPLFRRIALCALLLPFLPSALIANGIMPARSAGGAITLVICTAEGMAELVVDPATMQPLDGSDQVDPDQDGPQKQTSSCAWAANHADFAAPTPPVLALPSQHMVAALVPPAPTALIAARATGLPPSTGPPRPL